MKVAQYVIKRLEEVTNHVFVLVGGGSMWLNDALYDSKLTPVFMLHEQSAAFAAQAYGHLAGLGVCMTTSGPGATNAITGCLAAWMDSTPVLFISGNVATGNMMTGTGLRYVGPQECDIISMVKGITKYALCVKYPEWIEGAFNQALLEATSGRKGPAWLDIPLDVQGAEIE